MSKTNNVKVGDEIKVGVNKATITCLEPLVYVLTTGPNKGTEIHAGDMVDGLRALGIPQPDCEVTLV